MLASLIVAAAIAVVGTSQSSSATPLCRETYSERICTTPALDPLRAEMARKIAAVLATGNRTATWQARHDIMLAELNAARDELGRPMSDSDLEQAFRDHIADLDQVLRQAAGVRRMVKSPSALGRTCMATWLDLECRVTASGTLWSEEGKPIYWQMMAGASGDDGTGAGIVLWAGTGFGTGNLIGWSFDGAAYEPPRLTRDGLIWVPGRIMGTGNGNADLLFEWDETARAWHDIELVSWWRTVDAKLPRGFGIWQGVAFDFEEMVATSKLWREDDANCCPTGGDALLDFDIQGRSLVMQSVRVAIVEKWAPRKD